MELRYHLSIIQLVFILSFCQLHDVGAFLGVGVERAKPNELRFVASLAYDKEEFSASLNHFCTGTLISKKFILTARHCAINLSQTPCVIRIGCNSLRDCRKYEYKSWTSFETWAIINNRSLDKDNDDIAVIELAEAVEDITPAKLSSNPAAIRTDTIVHAAGWGSGEYGLRPNNLRKVSLRILDGRECDIRVRAYIPIASPDWTRTICTGTAAPSGYTVLRPGDSGGPLYDDAYNVIGVNNGVSQTFGEHESQINLHNTVHYYKDFLDSFFQDNRETYYMTG